MNVTIASILISRPSRNKSRQTALHQCLATFLMAAALSALAPSVAAVEAEAAAEAVVAAADKITASPDTPASTSVDAGIKAARAGRFADAIAILRKHAEDGDVIAHYSLGLIYSKARGAALPERPALAHRHFQAAAKKGHVGAVFELAFQFERGIGTDANMETALRLYRIAAHNNHLNAQFNLAVLLSRGGAVKANPHEAYFWALTAQHNASIKPQGALTFERVTRLVRQIRASLSHQAASRVSRVAIKLTGQPI